MKSVINYENINSFEDQTAENAYDLTMALLFSGDAYYSEVKAYAQAALHLSEHDMTSVVHAVLAGTGRLAARVAYTARGMEPVEGAYPMSTREAAIYDELVVPLSLKLGELAMVQAEGRSRLVSSA